DINEVVDSCNKILIEAAEKSGNIVTNHIKTRKKNSKPWFNSDCKDLRKNYHRCKHYHWRYKTAESRQNMVQASKAYKKIINKQFRAYQDSVIRKIRSLETTNPKAYWSIINRSCDYKKNVQDISAEAFLDHFKGLNQDDEDSDFPTITADRVTYFNTELNKVITELEVKKAILQLKNNKACASDMILNEFLKASQSLLMPVYIRLFNAILDSGKMPETWTDGFIIPIYKNKGDIGNPDNYRGITILSCMGKLFTSILNQRINLFLEEYGILGEEQAGFRKHYGTTDHIFNLKCIIDLYLCKKKKLYCAFIDYKKAFDSVDRAALWHKLLRNSVDGKIFVLIKNMYEQAKSCVRYNGICSQFFQSNVGVRQGENLSPILFSLFLNDLSEFMSNAYNGLEHITDITHQCLDTNEVEFFLKLYMLLYADDTVILAESPDELQAALNAMYLYCKTWNLAVNPTKTKVVIFSKSKLKDTPIFTYYGQVLNVESDFCYLGIHFDQKGSFFKAKSHLIEQAKKASFSVLKKARKLGLPADIQLKLFDHMIAPILLYGSEVWSYENSDIIESFHFKFCKSVMHLKASTPKCMLYGELGRFPMNVSMKCRMINFWTKLLSGKKDKLSFILYKILYQLDLNGVYHSQWLNTIRTTLQNCQLDEVWTNQYNIVNFTHVKPAVEKALKKSYVNTWDSDLEQLSKCLNYRMYKSEHKTENYFSQLSSSLSIFFCRFRCMNHRLPIEYGRFTRIERARRICKLCASGEIGDEFHYLFNCSFFAADRVKFIPVIYRKKPNALKFNQIMNTDDINILCKLATFCKKIVQHFDKIHK
ncbi:MAG: reverse transcriptase family protein, partial [Candidatus Thiodiazotropha sp.]